MSRGCTLWLSAGVPSVYLVSKVLFEVYLVAGADKRRGSVELEIARLQERHVHYPAH